MLKIRGVAEKLAATFHRDGPRSNSLPGPAYAADAMFHVEHPQAMRRRFGLRISTALDPVELVPEGRSNETSSTASAGPHRRRMRCSTWNTRFCLRVALR